MEKNTIPGTHLSKVFTGHLCQHGVEILLVLVVYESVVEHAHRLVTEQSEHLLTITDHASVSLQQTWNIHRENCETGQNTYYIDKPNQQHSTEDIQKI